MSDEFPEFKRYAKVKGRIQFVEVDKLTMKAFKNGVVMGLIMGFVLGAVPLWLAYNV